MGNAETLTVHKTGQLKVDFGTIPARPDNQKRKEQKKMKSLVAHISDLTRKNFNKGAIIIEQGSKTGSLFILSEGSVEVLKDDVQISVISEEGSVFGEISALLDTEHTATVRTLKPSIFYIVDDVAGLFKTKPEASLLLAKLLANRLVSMNDYFVDLRKRLFELTKEDTAATGAQSPEVEELKSFWTYVIQFPGFF